MENKAHALAAGAFVLGLVAVLVALVVWLTHDDTVRNTYELSTRDAVSGLQPQAMVRYRGIAVGKVTTIDFDPRSRATCGSASRSTSGCRSPPRASRP
jgi:phospholipid/cholesterol/gamma-HCH transport system substrate-binding protein